MQGTRSSLVDIGVDLSRYKAVLESLSKCGLIGAYVYGSVASGCHNPGTSDIDVVIVGSCISDPGFIEVLERIHADVDLPIDAAVVSPEQLRVERIPTPVGLLIKPFSGGKVIHRPEGSWDFVVQSEEVYERGLRLLGPEPRHLFQPVPWPLIRRYIEYLLPFIVSRFKNPVLMLCRCACTSSLRTMCSKKEAGEWALAEMPAAWHSLIDTALGEYAGDDSHPIVDRKTLLQFEKHIIGWVGERA